MTNESTPQLGPFKDVEIVTIAAGFAELRHLLSNGEGWHILWGQFHEVRNRRGEQNMMVPYVMLGRAIAEGEAKGTAWDSATELAESQDMQIREDVMEDIPPLRDEPVEQPKPIASRPRTAARPREVQQANSIGPTKTTGLRV